MLKKGALMKLPPRCSSTPDPSKRRWSSQTIRLALVLAVSIALGGLSLVCDPVSAITVAISAAASLEQIVRQLPNPR